MSDEIHERQNLQKEIQNSDEFVDVFSKIVSGRPNYKSVIEVKKEPVKCIKCGSTVNENQKFCHECGEKVFIKPKNCPKCSLKVSTEDKFCQECGTNLEKPLE